MSILVEKYILWILLSLPVLMLGIYFFSRLHKNIEILKKEEKERLAEEKRRKDQEDIARESRRRFNAHYDSTRNIRK